ncbi:hypothetical protein HYH03_009876 [Edaphochlamys debaryana]|uniref:Methyltransferase type 11 domain-containing protein n=1 Tax=Edaphochlamys debaryana TaxID=47281 RepID=A0A836BXY4_9CHLO|nr:hypothetical protein HYH03_009876 [Edaphochlamys debaryana]|eukprot:KAG2491713.1 hypothetical protein HYH03_009876 [Edaphochlamys debaryana]
MVALAAAQAVGPSGRVVGLDLSSGLLERAAAKARAAGLELELRQQDADAASFPAASFDAVTCCAALPFLPDPLASLRAWRGWLRPGGQLVFNAFRAPSSPEFGLLLGLLEDRHGLSVEDPCAPLGSAERCRGALEEAGFAEVQVWTEEVDEVVAKPVAEYVEGIWRQARHSPFVPLDSLLSAEALEALHGEYTAAATQAAAGRMDGAGEGAGGRLVATMTTFVARGVRPEG